MEKNDMAWVFVRGLGIYFLAQAIYYLFYLGVQLVSLLKLYDIAKTLVQAEANIVGTWVQIGIAGLELILFFLLAYYCLRRGQLIHSLLMHRGSNEES